MCGSCVLPASSVPPATPADARGSVAMATNNELVLLDQALADRQAERAQPIPDDEAFELFACEQVLRDYDLSLDEVAAGVIGGGNDGAIDGAYTFLADSLLSEDSEIFDDDFSVASVGPETELSLWIVQAKRTTSFTETALDLAASSTARMLDLQENEDDLRALYSPGVLARIELFRKALRLLAIRHVKVRVNFAYVTRGSTKDVNAKVLRKARDLEAQWANLLSQAEGSVTLIGCGELWSSISTPPSYTLQLTYQENATSGTSHVALVKLRDYRDFLTDQDGGLRRHIFDWNVRDYQGDVEVNREIRDSILRPDGPEFWWLNNGVTIICSRTSIVGRTYTLDDVQIVNGLQTSHSLFRSLRDLPDDSDVLEKAVLVRILVTEDGAVRDSVIRATNRQTSVPAASLRATDEIQRKIEKHFFSNGWFYDRRKNFYRNAGKSPERIVSIPLLAQAVMAMGLGRPDDSRGRPSSLLKRDDEYRLIFSDGIPLSVYLWAAKTQRSIDAFLMTPTASASGPERTNLRFHLGMMVAHELAGKRIHAPAQLQDVTDKSITDVNMPKILKRLRGAIAAYTTRTGDTADKAAKGRSLVTDLLP